MKSSSNQPTLFDIDTCGFGTAKSAQAVVTHLPPEPQVSVPNFVFNPLTIESENARMCWRILIQVLAIHFCDIKYPGPGSMEIEECKQHIENTLKRINELGRIFRPQFLPSDIVPPTAEYRALSVTGNWCDKLTQELTSLFSNVQNAGILKIDLYTLDSALPVESNAESLYNLPAMIEADNISIP